MAHFAELNSNNVVLRVIVISNKVITIDGIENEQLGIDFCKSLYGEDTFWKQTSYNSTFRKNFAGYDSIYNEEKDAFIAPQPTESLLDLEGNIIEGKWVLNEETCKWEFISI